MMNDESAGIVVAVRDSFVYDRRRVACYADLSNIQDWERKSGEGD
jgi:hypothetical protein